MEDLDTREWLLTNGLGSFASGTVCDAHTRTYHGWLIAALEPPSQRTLLLSRIDASLEVRGRSFELSTNFWTSGAIAPTGYRLLQQFSPDPAPTWTWGWNDWQLRRRLLMPHGLVSPDSPAASPYADNAILIEYRYEGSEPALLQLRPMIGDRIFHYQQHADFDLQFNQQVQPHCVLVQAKSSAWIGTPWQLSWSRGKYYPDGLWYWGYRYPEETRRGLADREDLFTPGYLSVLLQPGDTVMLEAKVGHSDSGLLMAETLDRALQAESQRLQIAFAAVSQIGTIRATSPQEMEGGVFTASVPANWTEKSAESSPPSSPPSSPSSSPPSSFPPPSSVLSRLLRAGDQFIAYRASISGPTVIAGYPWFNDWGRDTLIALPGLTLTTQRYELAKGLLRTYGMYCQQGLIPNAFPDAGTQPFYNSIDAPLWWIETLGLYLEATQDWDFLVEQYPIVWRIYKGLMAGTWYNIRVDAFDGLVTWDAPNVALTWMDSVVKEEPVTPRRGKMVEINALWYSALCWAEKWAFQLQHDPAMADVPLSKQGRRYSYQIDQVKASLQKFWNPAQGYLYDGISPDDYPDDSIRPNAVIALSLRHCCFSEQMGRSTLQLARDRLLTPYGLRSLDPADSRYVGKYEGGIWQRDRAYHQGTVWSWLVGPFIRAWQRFYPNEPVPFTWQALLEHFEQQACLGSISEMFDGDPPYTPRGAIAQAWSVAEVTRYYLNQLKDV